ncbi:nuclear pore complex protein NUP43 [Punica granatum]|uniref:Nuclear pore complex protein NUP43 n=2 Tax=Punica granatum TaxID=22663 RepID=A0A6P8BYG0_PUNGR|nr:nuclear pore complex protein NUP43-like [Punica granatum]XP_031382215.1 nuclear pore complex protein NUP43 [Punica granatum]OWM89980.1 hypothetical protein CDL15_Pgr012617 [Punica granatum]PKI70199.1 hypothetical protein CRG98_009391 [Punica granatum]
MAVTQLPRPPEVYKLPQYKYVDAVRWLPPISALDRHAVLALFDSDGGSSTVEIHSLLNPNPDASSTAKSLTTLAAWTPPSRVSSLKTTNLGHRPFIAVSTVDGSVHVLAAQNAHSLVEMGAAPRVHAGPVSCIDLVEGGAECVSVGEDGRVNLVSLGDSGVSSFRFFDSNGLVSYSAARWASPNEFATGGLGFGLQWWDRRKPGGPVSQFKCNWTQGRASGIVHSIDIHPSRKHTCLAGGSSGTIFAWDLRWQQQPIILSGVVMGDGSKHSVSDSSEVWEVQYDRDVKSSNASNFSSSSRMLPVMMCSEDGILAVVEEDEEPVELLAEPCAINSFDIDKQNPSDVICSLEWESVAILTRP